MRKGVCPWCLQLVILSCLACPVSLWYLGSVDYLGRVEVVASFYGYARLLCCI